MEKMDNLNVIDELKESSKIIDELGMYLIDLKEEIDNYQSKHKDEDSGYIIRRFKALIDVSNDLHHRGCSELFNTIKQIEKKNGENAG